MLSSMWVNGIGMIYFTKILLSSLRQLSKNLRLNSLWYLYYTFNLMSPQTKNDAFQNIAIKTGSFFPNEESLSVSQRKKN